MLDGIGYNSKFEPSQEKPDVLLGIPVKLLQVFWAGGATTGDYKVKKLVCIQINYHQAKDVIAYGEIVKNGQTFYAKGQVKGGGYDKELAAVKACLGSFGFLFSGYQESSAVQLLRDIADFVKIPNKYIDVVCLKDTSRM